MCYKTSLLQYISQLKRGLRLVNLVSRTLPYRPLKFKVGFVAKLFRHLSPTVENFLLL